jgi:hypothetical protein
MPLKDKLDRGPKVDCHIWLYADELAIIDQLAGAYDVGRSAVIAAWCEEYSGLDLSGRVTPGRRPGGGRKAVKEKS